VVDDVGPGSVLPFSLAAQLIMTSSPIVVVGSLTDDHARAIVETLQARGHEAFVFDAQRFPEQLPIALGHAIDDIVIEGRRIGRPRAVYLRSLYSSPAAFGVEADEAMKEDWRRTSAVFRERSTLLSSIVLRWEAQGVPIYNPISRSIDITKPYQLAKLAAAGLPVPRTLWSNDPEAVRRFCGEQPSIYKPVAGGAATRIVQPEDLSDARLAKLQASPVCFQELLPGDDVRVYVIDGRVVCALRIVTDAIDFRQHEQAIEPIELEPELAQQCIRAAALLGLRYTGMDIKGDRAGRFKILELNPSAMFLGFEARTGLDIRGALCDALTSA
jgi:glutathione synthase/RimK-type ligase-like ATP-grasp enzyme